MPARRDFSFSEIATALGVAVLLPAFLFGALAFTNLVRKDQAAQRDRLQQSAAALIRTVDAEFTAMKQIARVLAATRLLQRGEIAGFESLARDAAGAGSHDVVLLDAEGNQLVNTRSKPGQPLPQTRNMELLGEIAEAGQPIISNLFHATVDSQPAVIVSAPVNVSGRFAYAVSIVPQLTQFSKLLTTVPLPEPWMAAIDDRNGKIVARSRDPERFIGSQARLRTQPGDVGLVEFVDLQGQPSLMAFAVSRTSGYRAVVWAPERAFYASANDLMRTYGLVAVLTMLITALTGLVSGRTLRRPLADLVSAARALARGEQVSTRNSRLREINIVGSALEVASGTIQAREAALLQESEKNKELIKELAHRTKNMMAVIAAIARQSARSSAEGQTDLGIFVRTFEARLASLARSNDLVLNAKWDRVPLADLVADQLSPFGFGSRIKAQGPNLLLAPHAVQPIGLALHELATNAVKYGPLSIENGTVSISWQISDGRFEMQWMEKNGPPASTPKRKGFGSTVIENICAVSLSATSELEYLPTGLVWRLSADLARVAADTPAAPMAVTKTASSPASMAGPTDPLRQQPAAG